MRLSSTVLLGSILLLGGCRERGIELNFVVPDGYTGILKIQNFPQEKMPKPTNGVIELSFSTNGLCIVGGEVLKKWH